MFSGLGEHEFVVELMIQGHLGSQTDLKVKTEKSQKPKICRFWRSKWRTMTSDRNRTKAWSNRHLYKI